jgi:hypothetical protein
VIDFYPAKNNDRLNRTTFAPESVGGRVMVNPRYPIRELAVVQPWFCARCAIFHTFPRVRCDSGAFQDIGQRRYFPWSALSAQLRLEEQLRWLLGDQSFHFECIFIYDNPAGVDEAVVDGKKIKVRGTHATAARAVEDTVAAAHYYASQRHAIKGAIGFVGQGIDPDQYMGCVEAMLPLMQAGDVFGFGGFCIWGRMPKRITKIAHATIARAVPLLKAHGITDFHMLGVMYAPAIEWVADLARAAGVSFATDGSGPEQAGCIAGRGYSQGRQVDVGNRPEHKYISYHPCQLATENIRSYTEWTESL